MCVFESPEVLRKKYQEYAHLGKIFWDCSKEMQWSYLRPWGFVGHMGFPAHLHTLERWVRSFSKQTPRKNGWQPASQPPVNHEPKPAEAKTITRTKGQFILTFVPMSRWETHVPIGWHMAPTFSCIQDILAESCWSGRCHFHDKIRNYKADNGPFAQSQAYRPAWGFSISDLSNMENNKTSYALPLKWFNTVRAAKKELKKHCSLNP